jgi:TolB-like protein
MQKDALYKPSIAVLPFQNLNGEPEQEYFADGMVEDIITGPSRIKWLLVIARNSTFTYKGRPVDVEYVAVLDDPTTAMMCSVEPGQSNETALQSGPRTI